MQYSVVCFFLWNMCLALWCWSDYNTVDGYVQNVGIFLFPHHETRDAASQYALYCELPTTSHIAGDMVTWSPVVVPVTFDQLHLISPSGLWCQTEWWNSRDTAWTKKKKKEGRDVAVTLTFDLLTQNQNHSQGSSSTLKKLPRGGAKMPNAQPENTMCPFTAVVGAEALKL